MAKVVENWGLLAPPVLAHFIMSDSSLCADIKEFIASDKGEGRYEVVGPPSIQDLERRQRKEHFMPEMPTVILHLRRMKRDDGAPALEISCSDDDLEQVASWVRMEPVRREMLRKAG